jgi:hypothetical protein
MDMRDLTALFSLLRDCFERAAQDDAIALSLTVAGALLGGMLLFSLATWFACNTCRTFSRCHPLSIGVGALGALAIFFLVSLKHSKPIALATLLAWRAQVEGDSHWQVETFLRAFDLIASQRDASGEELEQLRDLENPRNGGSVAPAARNSSREIVAEVYSRAVTGHYRRNCHLLSLMILPETAPARAAVLEQITAKLQPVGDTGAPAREIVATAAESTAAGLAAQGDRVVYTLRWVFASVFGVFFLLFGNILRIWALREVDAPRISEREATAVNLRAT